jgi:hypothetical protein
LCLATSATVLVQMLIAAERSGPAAGMAVTLLFIVGPAIIGALLLWLGRRTIVPPGIGTRAAMFLLGLAALGLLAGYFAGPALAILAAIVPPYRRIRAAEAVLVGRVVGDKDRAARAAV